MLISSLPFCIDTGADASVLKKSDYDRLHPKPDLKRPALPLNGVFSSPRMPLGVCIITVVHNDKSFDIECHVVDNDSIPNLLSRGDSVRLNLVKRVYHAKTDKAEEILRDFSDVFQGVGKMPGEYSLKVDPSIPTIALNARPIPAALYDSTKAKLSQLVDMNIIKRVQVGETQPWCSQMHVVNKKVYEDGKVQPTVKDIRITIDPRELNKALQRERYPLKSIEEITTRTDGSKFFTTFDANMGYFQIALDEDSQNLTTFNTPFGRFKYLRLPMGIKSAPEIYQRAMSDTFSDLEGVEVIMDDILLHGPTLEVHNERLKKVLERCRERNLKLNRAKTKLCRDEVSYIGHCLTKDGVKIAEDKVKAVEEMPEPTSIAEVQTLLGMVTYTCKFLQNLSSITEPLGDLIKEANQPGFIFHFDEVHMETVKNLKKLMTTAPVLRYYSLTEPIVLSNDASQSGLGSVILQGGRPVAYASKSLTAAEQNYSQIEKEMLTIVYAFKKFHTYVYGRHDITVETDHLPLVRIFQKPLHQVPLRLQKMRLVLQQYDFTVVDKSGKEIPVADALSRAYLKDTEANLMKDIRFTELYAEEVRGFNAFSVERQTELHTKTAEDETLQELKKQIEQGWPSERHEIASKIAPFWDSRDELSVTEGIIFKGDRVVIPKAMQSHILKLVHASHLGIVKCKQLARDTVYWPGMNSQIEETVSKCAECQENRNQQSKETLIPSEIPRRPFQIVAVDLLQSVGSNFLVLVDYYSDFIEVEELSVNTHSVTVIEKLARIFAAHGRPEKLITDNGPQFRSNQFTEFVNAWNINHVTTSPYMHQANGKVESANQTIRHLLEKCSGNRTNFYCSLLQLRNTPNPTYSPAQNLMSRRTLTKLPTAPQLLKPEVVKEEEVKEVIERKQEKYKKYYDARSKDLPPIQPGDSVRYRVGNK